MDKLININQLGGFPLKSDDFRFLFGTDATFDAGAYQALNAICAAFGDNYIVTGCGITGTTVAEGWVFLGGELIKVDEHETTNTTWEKVTTTTNERTFKSGAAYDVRQVNRATRTAAAGAVLSDSVTSTLITANPATTTSKGFIELATGAELLAGTDEERAVTPSLLANRVVSASTATTAAVASSNADILTYSGTTRKNAVVMATLTVEASGGTGSWNLWLRQNTTDVQNYYILKPSADELTDIVTLVAIFTTLSNGDKVNVEWDRLTGTTNVLRLVNPTAIIL